VFHTAQKQILLYWPKELIYKSVDKNEISQSGEH